MKVSGKRCFISGPMSGRESYNVHAFVDAHVMLKDMGAVVAYNPAIEWLRYDGDQQGHEFWMRRCIAELVGEKAFSSPERSCFDILVSLPGWEDSSGATIERMVAKACGIAVCDIGEVE